MLRGNLGPERRTHGVTCFTCNNCDRAFRKTSVFISATPPVDAIVECFHPHAGFESERIERPPHGCGENLAVISQRSSRTFVMRDAAT